MIAWASSLGCSFPLVYHTFQKPAQEKPSSVSVTCLFPDHTASGQLKYRMILLCLGLCQWKNIGQRGMFLTRKKLNRAISILQVPVF